MLFTLCATKIALARQKEQQTRWTCKSKRYFSLRSRLAAQSSWSHLDSLHREPQDQGYISLTKTSPSAILLPKLQPKPKNDKFSSYVIQINVQKGLWNVTKWTNESTKWNIFNCEHPPLFAAFCSPFLGTTTNKNAQVTQRMSRCFVGSSSAVSACFPSWAQRRIRLLAARRVWCGLKRGAAIYGSSTKPPIRTYAPPPHRSGKSTLGRVGWLTSHYFCHRIAGVAFLKIGIQRGSQIFTVENFFQRQFQGFSWRSFVVGWIFDLGGRDKYWSGWWFQPIWKILVKMGIFPK